MDATWLSTSAKSEQLFIQSQVNEFAALVSAGSMSVSIRDHLNEVDGVMTQQMLQARAKAIKSHTRPRRLRAETDDVQVKVMPRWSQ